MIETGRTLYAHMPAWASGALLALVLLLTVLPALPHPHLYIPGEKQWGEATAQKSDAMLYQKIVADIIQGRDYYEAAAAEHRALRYPTSPPPGFRLPALAWMLAGLYSYALQLALLLGLDGAIIVLFYRELLAAQTSFPGRIASVFAVATGLSIVGVTGSVYWHEVWAALLMGISLLTYRVSRWWPAVLVGLLACLIREITVPYL